jgi:hypothetical protein
MALRTFTLDKTFDVRAKPLKEILAGIASGKIQLPLFQRKWRWPNENIKSLLESVIDRQSIGMAMFLETGGEIAFDHRPVEGSQKTAAANSSPTYLILDGQQRLTSLQQVCNTTDPVLIASSKGHQYRNYYFHYGKAITTDSPTMDCIIDRRVYKDGRPMKGEEDYSDPDFQYANGIFPINQMLDPTAWREGHKAYWDAQPRGPERDQAISWLSDFRECVPPSFALCEIAITTLNKNLSVDGVCTAYEKLNTKGVPLNTFDLMIAYYASNKLDLSDEWENPITGIQQVLKRTGSSLLSEIDPKQFMQTVMFISALKGGKALDMQTSSLLKFEPSQFIEGRQASEKAFANAAKFLSHEGFMAKWMAPPAIVIMSLATILSALGHAAESIEARGKLKRWLSCVMYTSAYFGNDKLLVSDVPEVISWIRDNGPEPRTVDRTHIVDSSIADNSKKGTVTRAIVAAILKNSAVDFSTGNPISAHSFSDNSFDLHHIFPAKWCKAQGIPEKFWNSIVNKTPMSISTNRRVGSRAPSEYLDQIGDHLKCDATVIDRYVASHGINPEHLRANDFMAFFHERKEYLASLVSKDTGRNVMRNTDPDEEVSTVQPKNWPESAVWLLTSKQGVVYLKTEGDSFVVTAGTIMSADQAPSLYGKYAEARAELIDNGSIEISEDGTKTLLVDYPATSLSAAASIFSGNTQKGRWIDRDGVTANF